MRQASVAVDIPVRREFTYSVPRGWPRDLLGRRVAVRFSRRVVSGVVVGQRTGPPEPGLELRPLLRTLDAAPLFDDLSLRFLRRCAERRLFPLGQLISAALPAALRGPRTPRLDFAYRVVEVPSLGILQRGDSKALGLFGAEGRLGAKELAALSPRQRQRVKGLAQKGILEEEIDLQGSVEEAGGEAPAPKAAGWAAKAAGAILAARGGGFGVHLCRAHPGRDRTELLLRLVERTVREGRQALVLAPGIAQADSLARATVARLPGRATVASHAGVPGHRRAMGWLGAAWGHADVIVGTRSAVLTPMPRLGLAIVDDAHDPDLAQDEAPRYGACDLARIRCEDAGIPLVLCTPTPALEDHLESKGEGSAVVSHGPSRSNVRAGRSKIVIEDVRDRQMYHGLAAPLVSRLKRGLGRGEAAMVLVNRRGWARRVLCPRCAHVPSCERCGLALAAHRRERTLRCHLCGHSEPLPDGCGHCGHAKVSFLGRGSEQVEEGLRKAIPDARIVRWDSDAAGEDADPGRVSGTEEEIRRGGADIIVGTSLATRLRDMDNLARIIVADADERLMSPDFRATERLMAWLVGISRWQRKSTESPSLTVQTRFPGHELFRALSAGDVPGYWDLLLEERKSAGLPPCSALGVVRAWGADQAKVVKALTTLREKLQGELDGTEGAQVLGVVPSHLRRRPGIHRHHFAVRAKDEEAVRAALAIALRLSGERAGGGVRIEHEVAPRKL